MPRRSLAPASTPRLSITLLGFGPHEVRRMVEVAGAAEAAGIDDVQVSEHVLMHGRAFDTFPPAYGRFFHALDEPMPEPLVTLAAIAAATTSIRLVSGILIAPLRPAGLLAKQAATVHALSGGRLVLGVSTSWQAGEYAALGVPFAERGQRLEDTIGACRALWSAAPAEFHSPSVNFSDIYCQPRPGTAEAIPVWFGGKATPRLVRRVATLGAGWILFSGLGETATTIHDGVSRLREALAAAGRDPDSLEVSSPSLTQSPDLDRTFESLPALFEAGVTVIQVGIQRYVRSPDEALDFVHRLAERFAPFRRSAPSGAA